MAKPLKKLSVSSEQRKQWLKRYEENSESPPQIADNEGYDVRTVRKHLELARQERETRETRSIVLRTATESHYQDLCKFSERIGAAIGHGNLTTSLETERMWTALKKHLPQSPLWKCLDKWNNLNQTLDQARADLRTKLGDEITNDHALNQAFNGGKEDVAGLIDVFAKQSEFWSRGSVGLDEYSFRTEPAENGLVNLFFGAYHIGTISEIQAAPIKKAIIDIKHRLSDLTEYQKLGQFPELINQVKADIDEELATIILRRIVPGRCKYCPI